MIEIQVSITGCTSMNSHVHQRFLALKLSIVAPWGGVQSNKRTSNEMTTSLVEQRRETKVVTRLSMGAAARGRRTVPDKILDLVVKKAGIQSRRSVLQEQCVSIRSASSMKRMSNKRCVYTESLRNYIATR